MSEPNGENVPCPTCGMGRGWQQIAPHVKGLERCPTCNPQGYGDVPPRGGRQKYEALPGDDSGSSELEDDGPDLGR